MQCAHIALLVDVNWDAGPKERALEITPDSHRISGHPGSSNPQGAQAQAQAQGISMHLAGAFHCNGRWCLGSTAAGRMLAVRRT